MLVLVANLGSTSFKYRLFRMEESGGEVVAKGGYERVTDYAEVIKDALDTLQRDGVIASPDEIDAVGFKTVLGKDLSGCVIADQKVIDALDGFTAVAPAHNPPYAAGIRQFQNALPQARLDARRPQARDHTHAAPRTDRLRLRLGVHDAAGVRAARVRVGAAKERPWICAVV
jgi:acetate kinase